MDNENFLTSLVPFDDWTNRNSGCLMYNDDGNSSSLPAEVSWDHYLTAGQEQKELQH
jgi:hypothetical protein